MYTVLIRDVYSRDFEVRIVDFVHKRDPSFFFDYARSKGILVTFMISPSTVLMSKLNFT